MSYVCCVETLRPLNAFFECKGISAVRMCTKWDNRDVNSCFQRLEKKLDRPSISRYDSLNSRDWMVKARSEFNWYDSRRNASIWKMDVGVARVHRCLGSPIGRWWYDNPYRGQPQVARGFFWETKKRPRALVRWAVFLLKWREVIAPWGDGGNRHFV